MNQTPTNQARRPAWLWLLLSLGAVAIDQLTKWLCVAFLKGSESVPLIRGFLHLTYVENRGAAFGSFSEHRWVFMVISTLAIVGVTVYLLKFCENDRLLRCALAMIVGAHIKEGMIVTVVPTDELITLALETKEASRATFLALTVLHLCEKPTSADYGMRL